MSVKETQTPVGMSLLIYVHATRALLFGAIRRVCVWIYCATDLA